MYILKMRLSAPTSTGPSLIRHKLWGTINDALNNKKSLFVLTAPAGSGKTTFLAQCETKLAERGHKTLWLTMDEKDSVNEQAAYIYAALNTCFPESPINPPAVLKGKTQGNVFRSALSALICSAEAYEKPLYFFIDDFSNTAPDLVNGFKFLLKHRPPNLCLFLSSQHKMPISLAKYKMEGRLQEINFHTLCLDREESSLLLRKLGLQCDEDSISRLYGETGGWPALLKLTALEAMEQPNVGDYISSLSDKREELADFIQDEVLTRISKKGLRFLSQLTICERLCIPLCTAISQDEKLSNAMLDNPELQFMIHKLDEEKDWFRLHPLLRQILLGKLDSTANIDSAELHRRASRWFEEEGHFNAALHHAILAGDNQSTIELMEEHGIVILQRGQINSFLEIFDNIPDTILEQSQEILFQLGILTNLCFQLEKTPQIVAQLKSILHKSSSPDPVLYERIRLLECTTCNLAQDYHGMKEICGEFIHRGEPANTRLRTEIWWRYLRGMVHFHDNEFVDALRLFETEAPAESRIVINSRFQTMDIYRAIINLELGRFERALECLPTLKDSEWEQLGRDSIMINWASAIAGALDYYSGNLPSASNFFSRCMAALMRSPEPRLLQILVRAQSHIYQSKGEPREALATILAVRGLATSRVYVELEGAMVAEAVRFYLVSGERTRAQQVHSDWLDRQKCLQKQIEQQNVEDKLNEWELLSNARLNIADRQYTDALAVLAKLEEKFRDTDRRLRQIEVLLLVARCHIEMSDEAAASQVLSDALDLDLDHRLIQLFRDEGPEILNHLRKLLKQLRAASPREAKVLQQQFIQSILDMNEQTSKSSSSSLEELLAKKSSKLNLLGDLTRRELDTLEVLANGYSNKEISEKLFISLPTVKSHLRSAYSKLGVSHRIQAVRLLIGLGFDATPEG